MLLVYGYLNFGFGNAIIYFVMVLVLISCYSCLIHNVVG